MSLGSNEHLNTAAQGMGIHWWFMDRYYFLMSDFFYFSLIFMDLISLLRIGEILEILEIRQNFNLFFIIL